MNLKNKTVWITGASSGIGAACAIEFAKEGASLILSARNETKLAEVKNQCVGASEVHILPMDVADHSTISTKTKEAIAKAGEIHILINNAGISQRGLITESNLEIDKKIFDVNFFGNIAIVRALLPHMIKRKNGAIAVISSVTGKLSTPLRSAYSASKHALHGWYDALRAEIAADGIQVNIICPGYIKTDISINAIGAQGKKHGVMDKNQAQGISAEKCARHILMAILKNKKESFVGGKEIHSVKLRNFLPGVYYTMLEKMAAKLRKA